VPFHYVIYYKSGIYLSESFEPNIPSFAERTICNRIENQKIRNLAFVRGHDCDCFFTDFSAYISLKIV